MSKTAVKTRTSYRCSECSAAAPKWLGKCPDCGSWGTMAEVTAAPAARGAGPRLTPASPAQPISQISAQAVSARTTGIGELDRVLGGGMVAGSVVLLAGEPGVGKSTLLLEVVHQWARRDEHSRALYVTGEESAAQVRLRAERTGAVNDRVFLAAETDLATILGHIDAVAPTLVIVDSVQTMSAADIDGSAGGVAQTKAVTAALTSCAKHANVAVILIGHVTKEGSVAGPRTLEHLVDVVLHFEGDRHSSLRLIRGIKNRFGPTDEVGCFELREEGIRGVADPSGLFLHHRDAAVPGTAITVAMDGRRALLAECQALVTPTQAATPRRAVSGLDANRVALIAAVLHSRCGIQTAGTDIYAATVGGMRLTEPCADLAIAMAMSSARANEAVGDRVVILGEVGLAGEVRPVTAAGHRLREAHRLGYTHALVPVGSGRGPAGMRVTEVADVSAALAALHIRGRRRPAEDGRE